MLCVDRGAVLKGVSMWNAGVRVLGFVFVFVYEGF